MQVAIETALKLVNIAVSVSGQVSSETRILNRNQDI
jgi:hypothetical protein